MKRNRFEWLISLMLRCAEIKTPDDYFLEAKNHPDWPMDPESFCGPDWGGWNRMLVKRNIRDFPSFSKLILMVRDKRIVTKEDYWQECQRILLWPINPQKAYPEEWSGWEEFFRVSGKINLPENEDCGLIILASRKEACS